MPESGEGRSYKNDAFLNFRGFDTRPGFTNNLNIALKHANFTTFFDDERINNGDDLKPELVRGIKESRLSIIVLSKNYASSSWCLEELVLILEQLRESGQSVIVIFYHVEPTHIRKQEGTFGDAIAEYRRQMEAEQDASKRQQLAERIDRWIKALTEVANLKGMSINEGYEDEFIKEIVQEVHRRIQVPLRTALPHLIGMRDSIVSVNSWLKDGSSLTGDILTILAMSGFGKTSLAKYVYLSHFKEFDTYSYIEDVSRRCARTFNGLLDVQKQLCEQITKTSSVQIHDVSMYTSTIENAVSGKKVLIVLDDINSLDQLNALLGNTGFHPGSKIIVTTEHAKLTTSCELFKKDVKPKHAEVMLKGLNKFHSQQLFCFHAFRSSNPKAGYEDVLKDMLNYCDGHPLALKFLGESLYDRDIAYWTGCKESLEKENCPNISRILKICFDSLPYDDDKDLFKHIACFFVGMDRDFTEMILKACKINTSVAFTNLIDKCLLSIDWDNKLTMHRSLQEMGRFIVRQESVGSPWERSRLWCHEESFQVLKRERATKNIRGLILDMRMLEKERLCGPFELNADAFKEADNLMLLQLNYVQIEGSYRNFSKELRWLCMHGFPEESIPLDLPMKNLVVLDMSYSNIKSFGICYSNTQRRERRRMHSNGNTRRLSSLKILNLSFCHRLRSLGGFDDLPVVERLIVTNCYDLVEVCESIDECVELEHIDMRHCMNLEKLPRNIRMLRKVQTLLLDGCNLGESTSLEAIPSHLNFITISLPRSLVSLSLTNNNLSTESFPMDFSYLSMLKNLRLDGNPIVSMPSCVRTLPRLEKLSMEYCKMLTTVEHPPHTLRKLLIDSDCKPVLEKVVFLPEMPPFHLSIEWELLAPSSFTVEGMVKVQPITGVEENVLHCLGWTNLDFTTERQVRTYSSYRKSEKSQIQMYFEFGIFSTIYRGKVLPNWITYRSMCSSISFIIPSSPNNLRGLNLCFVQKLGYFTKVRTFDLPTIIISNETTGRTWTYEHYINRVNVGGKYLTLLSHWMFGMNEMEAGDHVTITLIEYPDQVTKECGVSFVYDDGNTDEEEEEDPLGYYKSWNHVIGGDLTGFELSPGKYSLRTKSFLLLEDRRGGFRPFAPRRIN